ncbi:MAG: hypothetical protein LBK99_17915 [Opitutaceae bacterium]|jgi:NADPH:quinone reductase-like Zn-dependent oxidoreductase|nr:hypothetical protein [Opitutaceae bacterium]
MGKILFIGGTGVISTACTRLAAHRGIELHLLTRSGSSRTTLTEAAADIATITRAASARGQMIALNP